MTDHTRAYRDSDDLERILELRRACTTPENLIDFPALVDLGELFAPGEATPQHTRLWLDAGDHLIACAIVQLPYRNLYWFIRPGSAIAELEDAINAFGVDEVRAFNTARGEAGTLDALCRDSDAARVACLARHGFAQQDKSTLVMLRPLAEWIPDPDLPPGFIVRAVAGEHEVEAYVALHRAAFGTQNMTVAHRLVLMRDLDYRAAGDLVAVAPDGTLAAFCVCQIHPAENAAMGLRWGWTDPVGTHPAYQRHGLARALLLAGMHYLRKQGMETAALFALSSNPAVRLYESVGYRTARSYVWYARAV